MDDCVSDMSTGTLALAKDRRTPLKCIHWKTDLPNRWKRVCLHPKNPNSWIWGGEREKSCRLISVYLWLRGGRRMRKKAERLEDGKKA